MIGRTPAQTWACRSQPGRINQYRLLAPPNAPLAVEAPKHAKSAYERTRDNPDGFAKFCIPPIAQDPASSAPVRASATSTGTRTGWFGNAVDRAPALKRGRLAQSRTKDAESHP